MEKWRKYVLVIGWTIWRAISVVIFVAAIAWVLHLIGIVN